MSKHDTRGVRPFSKDRLMMMSRDAAARCAVELLDKVQQQPPEVAFAGACVLFATWCSRLRMDPKEMHSYGMKIITPEPFHQKANIHVDTLATFARIRMAGDKTAEVR